MKIGEDGKDNTLHIEYVKGDATQPRLQLFYPNVIVHCVNAVGKWGAGFSGALGRRYPEAERDYRAWKHRALGGVLLTPIHPLIQGTRYSLFVAHIVGQAHVRAYPGQKVLNEGALGKGLIELMQMIAKGLPFIPGACHIHMPRIGTGLAGGTWESVTPLLQTAFGFYHPGVYVYDPS